MTNAEIAEQVLERLMQGMDANFRAMFAVYCEGWALNVIEAALDAKDAEMLNAPVAWPTMTALRQQLALCREEAAEDFEKLKRALADTGDALSERNRARLERDAAARSNNVVACVNCKTPVQVTALNAIRCEACRSGIGTTRPTREVIQMEDYQAEQQVPNLTDEAAEAVNDAAFGGAYEALGQADVEDADDSIAIAIGEDAEAQFRAAVEAGVFA